MDVQNISKFYGRTHLKKKSYPLNGFAELTYRCNLNCIHCYCKGSEDKDKELTTKEWKKQLEEIRKEGCLWLTLTGGEPLLREDFLEIYSCAREKGFIIAIFTNGQEFRKEIIDYLVKFPPCIIELSLNGITQKTYESITQIEGSFLKIIETIHKLVDKKLPLMFKSNVLQQNKHEIVKIKNWVEKLLGKSSHKECYFRYDVMVYPRLNGDTRNCQHRVYFRDLVKICKKDLEIWRYFQHKMNGKIFPFDKRKQFLYQCTSWRKRFYINPYGVLQFCQFSDKFRIDLKKTAFKEGFYSKFPQILNEKFKTDSKCKNCELKPICYRCPSIAYLETGNEESPVEYYCQMAKDIAEFRNRTEDITKYE